MCMRVVFVSYIFHFSCICVSVFVSGLHSSLSVSQKKKRLNPSMILESMVCLSDQRRLL